MEYPLYRRIKSTLNFFWQDGCVPGRHPGDILRISPVISITLFGLSIGVNPPFWKNSKNFFVESVRTTKNPVLFLNTG